MPNPYLPLWEYIPDGEPRVFGDRIYVYGSHDTAGSDTFCDYVLKCWSAPVDGIDMDEHTEKVTLEVVCTQEDRKKVSGIIINSGGYSLSELN